MEQGFKRLHRNQSLRIGSAGLQDDEKGGSVGQQPVKQDHYSVLGVAPSADQAEIRAAYRALMRKFHPDADPGSEAAERAREINAAYNVLGSPEKRAAYDETLSESRTIRFDPVAVPAVPAPVRTRVAAGGAMLIAMLAAAMIGYAIHPSWFSPLATEKEWAIEPSPDLTAMEPALSPGQSCAGPRVNDLVKQELFRRASQRRPDAAVQLQEIEASTVARIAVKDGARSGDCSGWLSLDIPSGVAVDGGRTNLNADVAFGLTQAGTTVRLATLTGVERVVRSLSSIGPAPKEPSADELAAVAIEPQPAAVKAPAPSKPRAVALSEAKAGKTQLVTPCSGLAGRTDRMLCGSANLESLDRQVSSFYRQSWSQADEQKRSVLLRTRQAFNERRDACASPNCMTSAYVSRLRQISEIMAGRPQP